MKNTTEVKQDTPEDINTLDTADESLSSLLNEQCIPDDGFIQVTKKKESD